MWSGRIHLTFFSFFYSFTVYKVFTVFYPHNHDVFPSPPVFYFFLYNYHAFFVF